MIEIQCAGAGAGKTFGLAEALLSRYASEVGSHKVIAAITYTNAAKRKIEAELIKNFGNTLPETIQVHTVHSFLLQEVVFSFSAFVLNQRYNQVSHTHIQDRWASSAISRLKKREIVHVEDVYAAARRCLDETMSMHSTNAKKRKVRRALEIMSASISKIYVDEAQDLDPTGLRVFEVIGTNVCDVFMVGDPKQAIRYSSAFSNFIQDAQSKDENYLVADSLNKTRRIPQNILKLSNRFCPPGQEQTTLSNVKGRMSFFESTDPDSSEFLQSLIDFGALVCINKSQDKYQVRHGQRFEFQEEIKELLLPNAGSRDPEIFIDSCQLKFQRDVISLGLKKAISQFLKEHKITYDSKIYAMLAQVGADKDEEGLVVSSIDSVKGLEADICVLVLSPVTYRYLVQKDIEPGNVFNKEWNRVYVAITRARSHLMIFLDHDIFPEAKFSIEEIRKDLLNLGFEKCDVGSEANSTKL